MRSLKVRSSKGSRRHYTRRSHRRRREDQSLPPRRGSRFRAAFDAIVSRQADECVSAGVASQNIGENAVVDIVPWADEPVVASPASACPPKRKVDRDPATRPERVGDDVDGTSSTGVKIVPARVVRGCEVIAARTSVNEVIARAVEHYPSLSHREERPSPVRPIASPESHPRSARRRPRPQEARPRRLHHGKRATCFGRARNVPAPRPRSPTNGSRGPSAFLGKVVNETTTRTRKIQRYVNDRPF